MRWIPASVVIGVQNLFGAGEMNQTSRAAAALERIREAMLEGMGVGDAVAASKLELRVIHAGDLQDLWYLRGDVMAAIAAVDGEAVARQKLTEISDMFKGLLPKSLTARPSGLRG